MSNLLKLRDGVQIYYLKDSVENPKAVLLINHGFAEHSSRYDYVAQKFNDANYSVYRYDLRAHGRTKSELGHIESFQDFIDDANEMVNLIKKENKNIPVFMLGHSMGGLITALYGIKYPESITGQIFSGAALGYLPSVEGIKKYLFLILNTFLKKTKINNPIDDSLCSVQEVFYDYINDDLVLKEATINFYVEFLIKAVRSLNLGIRDYRYPCFLTHGEMDKVVPRKHSVNFYNNISSTDKEIKIYDNLYHEILNERERDQIIKDMVQWMNQRI